MPPKKQNYTDDVCRHIYNGYGTKSHGTFAPGMYGVSHVITDYEPLKFSTFRVFTALRGTVLHDSVLMFEQAIITLIFCASALPVYMYFNQRAQQHPGDNGMSIRKWLDSQETRMREFALIMMLLTSLLLTFYTAMAVSRWWAIRAAGIGSIKSAEMELQMLISQMVTQDQQVLGAIRRYARASLVLVFMWRRKCLGIARQELIDKVGLTPNEATTLTTLKNNHCLHETIWAWQSAIIATLYREGRIKSDQLLRTLLEKVSEGRQGVQVIHTHLAVKIPMQYVHLLGLLVKMHNFVLAVIMGSLFGAALRNNETIICCQLFGRTLILPLLFNAILLINAELSDPFDGHPTDFPGTAYQNDFEKTGASFVKASINMPGWLQTRRGPLPV